MCIKNFFQWILKNKILKPRSVMILTVVQGMLTVWLQDSDWCWRVGTGVWWVMGVVTALSALLTSETRVQTTGTRVTQTVRVTDTGHQVSRHKKVAASKDQASGRILLWQWKKLNIWLRPNLGGYSFSQLFIRTRLGGFLYSQPQSYWQVISKP